MLFKLFAFFQNLSNVSYYYSIHNGWLCSWLKYFVSNTLIYFLHSVLSLHIPGNPSSIRRDIISFIYFGAYFHCAGSDFMQLIKLRPYLGFHFSLICGNSCLVSCVCMHFTLFQTLMFED